jgi:hypothetical protein
VVGACTKSAEFFDELDGETPLDNGLMRFQTRRKLIRLHEFELKTFSKLKAE